MPAVLIKTGFISNYDDERYLNSHKGQQEISEAIARTLIKYKKQMETCHRLRAWIQAIAMVNLNELIYKTYLK